jgi:hypothetical protein
MDRPLSFSKPDLLNLGLLVLMAIFLALHVAKSSSNEHFIADQEADHISKLVEEVKQLKVQVAQLKVKNSAADTKPSQSANSQ